MKPLDTQSVNIKILRSTLFSPHKNIRFGMSTRCGGVSPPPYNLNMSFKVGDEKERVLQNRQRFFGQLGISTDRLAIPNQVHGSEVIKVSSPGIYDACDGLITSFVNVFLTVTVADCVPVFIFDPDRNAVAVVHAGWRGSKAGIVKNAISSMVREFGTVTSVLLAYVGPSAGVCCYEIGNDIAEQFDEMYIVRRAGRNPHLDMRAIQMDDLLDAGVKMNNIEMSHYCTICAPDLLHSYRLYGRQSGRMMGVLGLIQV